MVKVIIADDSPFLRNVLKDILEQSQKINVVGEAKNGKEAIDLVKRLHPDILVLDCEMPVMNGLEALRKVMAECPLPVFMFSSLTSEGSSVTLKALEYGAVDFLLKPIKGAHSLDEVADEIIRKIEYFALKGKYRKTVSPSAVMTQPPPARLPGLNKSKIDLIAIGSSTGGVQAAVQIIENLPEETKPIVWVQHMPPNFTYSFANRLNGLAKITVKEAENGEEIKNSTCYIAKGGYQMRIIKKGLSWVLKVEGEEKVSGHCPSCNVLFDSVSEYFSNNVLGVILTGMGNDGTEGLIKMHDKGAFVIGQNESSCIVYGMPRAAYDAGAVDVQVDIAKIADAIVQKGGAG